jgi:hypothetical protein
MESIVGGSPQSLMFATLSKFAANALFAAGKFLGPAGKAKLLTTALFPGLATQASWLEPNAPAVIELIVLGKLMERMPFGSAKARAPTEVTPSGIVTLVKLLVLLRVLAPIEVKLDGVSKDIEVMPDVQNAPSMLVTLFGITTVILPVP